MIWDIRLPYDFIARTVIKLGKNCMVDLDYDDFIIFILWFTVHELAILGSGRREE